MRRPNRYSGTLEAYPPSAYFRCRCSCPKTYRIQCTCSGILLIGIHAQIRASALCRIALVKADKCRSESAPCRKGIYNERMQHGDARIGDIVHPRRACVCVHLLAVDYRHSDHPSVRLLDEQLVRLKRSLCGRAGGIHTANPAYLCSAALLLGQYSVIYILNCCKIRLRCFSDINIHIRFLTVFYLNTAYGRVISISDLSRSTRINQTILRAVCPRLHQDTSTPAHGRSFQRQAAPAAPPPKNTPSRSFRYSVRIRRRSHGRARIS